MSAGMVRAAVVAGLLVSAEFLHAQQITRAPRVVREQPAPVPVNLDVPPGTVVVMRVTLDERGSVVRVEVERSAGEELDHAAMGAVARTVFEPAEVDGKPAPVQVGFRYAFSLTTPDLPETLPERPVPPALEPRWEPARVSPVTFEGWVVDEVSQVPLAEVELYVRFEDGGLRETATDRLGHFRLEGLPPGRHMVALTATGYEQLTVIERFSAGEFAQARYPLRALAGARFETVVRDRMRRATRVSMVVGSVQVVSEEQLRLTAPQSANEVLRTLPGIHVVDEDGSGLRSNIGFRGLDPNRSRKVLVLEDGVPISIAPYGEPEGYYTPAIERLSGIEVAKGADAILHGPQTIGGVLNFVTADPPRKPHVALESRAGTHGYWMARLAGGDTRGPVGWRLDVVHRRFMGPRRLDLQLLAADGKVRLELSPLTAFTLKAGAYSEGSRATYLGLTTPQYEHDPNENFAIHDRFDIQRYSASVQAEHAPASQLRIKVLTYWHTIQRHWRRQDYDRQDQGLAYERTASAAPNLVPDNEGGSIFFKDTVVFRNRQYTVAGIEPRWTLGLGWGPLTSEILAGARLHGEQAKEQRLDGQHADALSGDVSEDEIRTGVALALFAQWRLTFFDSLRFTPGVRLEGLWANRHLLRTRIPDENGALVPVDVDVQENSPTYAVIPGMGVSYALMENLMFFAGVHRGFAPPRTKDAVSPSGENLHLDAELSWNYEAGARFAAGDSLFAEAAVFYLEFQNQIVPPSEAGGATAGLYGPDGARLVNGGRSRHMGAESSVTVDVAQMAGFSFRNPYTLSYTYVNTRWVGGIFDGHRLPYAPEHMATGRVQFIHPLGFEGQLTAGYLSPQFTDSENTKNPTLDGTRGSLGRRLILDGRVAYTFPPLGWSVYLSAKNLTDYDYIASRAPQGIQPGMTRQFMLGVRGEL
jgi:Fe(3+) dicitrate transport protein